jgi:hypothetical protein
MSDEQETLFADGFEGAFLGLATRFCWIVAVYDYDMCCAILRTRDGMTEEEAEEFMEFNVTGAFVGECTPIFLQRGEGTHTVEDAKAYLRALED